MRLNKIIQSVLMVASIFSFKAFAFFEHQFAFQNTLTEEMRQAKKHFEIYLPLETVALYNNHSYAHSIDHFKLSPNQHVSTAHEQDKLELSITLKNNQVIRGITYLVYPRSSASFVLDQKHGAQYGLHLNKPIYLYMKNKVTKETELYIILIDDKSGPNKQKKMREVSPDKKYPEFLVYGWWGNLTD